LSRRTAFNKARFGAAVPLTTKDERDAGARVVQRLFRGKVHPFTKNITDDKKIVENLVKYHGRVSDTPEDQKNVTGSLLEKLEALRRRERQTNKAILQLRNDGKTSDASAIKSYKKDLASYKKEREGIPAAFLTGYVSKGETRANSEYKKFKKEKREEAEQNKLRIEDRKSKKSQFQTDNKEKTVEERQKLWRKDNDPLRYRL